MQSASRSRAVLQQILELHPFIAANTRHRRRPRQIGIGKFINHRLAEGVFIVQHVMRKAHRLGHAPRIVNIPPRTARAFFRQRRPVIIKLQGHAHHIIAFIGQLRRHDRAIHPARHRHHNARLRRAAWQSQGNSSDDQGTWVRPLGMMSSNIGKCNTTLNPTFHA